jgi:hypothetical protein
MIVAVLVVAVVVVVVRASNHQSQKIADLSLLSNHNTDDWVLHGKTTE